MLSHSLRETVWVDHVLAGTSVPVETRKNDWATMTVIHGCVMYADHPHFRESGFLVGPETKARYVGTTAAIVVGQRIHSGTIFEEDLPLCPECRARKAMNGRAVREDRVPENGD